MQIKALILRAPFYDNAFHILPSILPAFNGNRGGKHKHVILPVFPILLDIKNLPVFNDRRHSSKGKSNQHRGTGNRPSAIEG